jgi:hypothetical protein
VVGETGGEFPAPASHRLVGDDDATLSQDQFDIAQTEAEHMIQPNRVGDDLGGEPMTVVRVGRWHHVPISPASVAAAKPDYRDNAVWTAASTARRLIRPGLPPRHCPFRRVSVAATSAFEDLVSAPPRT